MVRETDLDFNGEETYLEWLQFQEWKGIVQHGKILDA